MLPGMIKIDDLNGAGEVLVGQIPDPDGSVADDDFELGPLPSSAPSFAIDAEAELLGGFDGAHISSGLGVADRPSFVVNGGLREHATEFTLARTGTLAIRSSGPTFGFSRNNGDLDTIHQHIHFPECSVWKPEAGPIVWRGRFPARPGGRSARQWLRR